MVQIADKIEDKIFWSNMKNCSELPILCRNMFNEAILIKSLNTNFNKHITKQGITFFEKVTYPHTEFFD